VFLNYQQNIFMHLCDNFFLMNNFPDFHKSGFDIIHYNETFEKKNVIICASSKDVSYPEHWGPLSIKCTLRGTEHYECHNRFYSVNEEHYLILNEGQYYSSYIYSDTATESFTVNFSTEFRQCVLESFQGDFDEYQNKSFEFIEKLYKHNDLVSPLLIKLYKASVVKKPDMHDITEIYYRLLENLLLQQINLRKEVRKINAVKYSTQQELYRRLHFAKDFIHSCYMTEVSIDKLASIACLNKAYFLREFKKYFGITPYQYIIAQRLKAAKKMLETTSYSITEICFAVGYHDITSFCKLFKKNFHTTPQQYQSGDMKKSFFTC
jgi:AraC family transcriptional regulator